MNEKITLKVVLEPGAYMPEKAHSADAGIDIRTPTRLQLNPMHSALIDTGVHILIPEGYVGLIKSKSGLATKDEILSDAGVIDAGYTGSIVVRVKSEARDRVKCFDRGDKIAQLVILPIPEIEFTEVKGFKQTERGDNGFGSTGR